MYYLYLSLLIFINFIGILLFIQFFNASIGYYEITKAGDAVAALKNSLQAKAIVKRDGKWQEINAIFVVPGDLVQLASGSFFLLFYIMFI